MKLEEMKPEKEASQLKHPRIVSEAKWLVARKDLLTREKELTRLRDEVSRHRRELLRSRSTKNMSSMDQPAKRRSPIFSTDEAS